MSWTGLQEFWRWLSLVGEGQLPSFLDGGEAFAGMGTQVLQDDEAEQLVPDPAGRFRSLTTAPELLGL